MKEKNLIKNNLSPSLKKGGARGWIEIALIISIFFIGILLRLYKLGSIPSSYSPDELAQGYTAYSLLTTGADEWGNRNPFILRSFGDFKLPFQTWLMIPAVKFFGLNTFAVRFPNALLSCLALLPFYLLIKKTLSPKSALFGLALLAFSPWSMPMSRLALEANILVSLSIFSLYFLTNRQVVSAAIFLAFGLSTYHSATILVVTLILGMVLFNPFKLSPKHFFLFLFTLAIFALPQKLNNLAHTSTRTNDIAIFHPTDNWQAVSDTRFQQTKNGLPQIVARSLNNKLTYTIRTSINNFVTYISPQFLTTSGAGETTYGMLPGFGVLGISLSVALIIGLFYYFSTTRHFQPFINFLLFCSLLMPFAGALAKGSYSANRVSLWLPILILLVTALASQFSQKILQLFLVLFIVESSYFVTTYFYQANNILADGMLYGHQQANQIINQTQPQKIIYSRKLSEPQAYYLFFQKPEPQAVQTQTQNWLEYQSKGLKFLDQLGKYNLDNVVFKEISLPSDLNEPNTLLIGRPDEFHDLKPSYIINYPSFTNDRPAIYLYLTPKQN